MVALTAAIAIVGSLAIFLLKPAKALAVYCAMVFCYVETQTIPLGPVDLSVGRIAVLPLLANVLLRTRLLKKFHWNIVDTFVILYMIGRLVALSQTVPSNLIVTREGGRFCDQILPYFAVRLILVTKEDFFTFLKSLVVMGSPLAVLGIYQCLTGHNPIGFLFVNPGLVERKGLWRAAGTFGNYLGFGLFFGVLAPLCLGLWHQKTWSKIMILVGFGFMMVGVISSMSSGPLMSITVAFAFLACYPIRKAWPALTVIIVCGLIFVEFFSNRHFYEVLDRIAFNPETARYRTGLIEEAFGGGMSGHWLEGFGFVGIGEDEFVNPEFDWFHTDMVNLYIGELARTGLLGTIPFMFINFYPYRRLYQAGMKSHNKADLWLIYCFGGALFGWHNAMMTVGSVAQTRILLFLLFAAATNMPKMIEAAAARVPQGAAVGAIPRTGAGRRRFLRARGLAQGEPHPEAESNA